MNVSYCGDCEHREVCRHSVEKEETEQNLRRLLAESNFDQTIFIVGLDCPYYKETMAAKLYRQSY